MSYTTKVVRDMFLDVVRDSDGHAVSLHPKIVYKDVGATYKEDDDEVKSGAKKVGDVKVVAKGWQEKDYDWDAELTRIFGEANSDLKSAITSAFTDTVKANYVKYIKGE